MGVTICQKGRFLIVTIKSSCLSDCSAKEIPGVSCGRGVGGWGRGSLMGWGIVRKGGGGVAMGGCDRGEGISIVSGMCEG